ncbi:Regulator of chromosome condensation 1/beta-lactamase-inhibitor protein II [Cryptosporidium tyzzeri]|nr:Regulator of chromosome condensation 1/beta-lactamase-inhibitor protein II [Cryptosporidium tyzzeri]
MKTNTESTKALYNKAFYVWHENFLKNSDNTVNTSPQPLAFICNVNIVDLSSSETFAGFITDQGYLYCWPWPGTISGRSEIKINPIAVTSVEEYVHNLSCGYNHISCATESNSLYIWIFSHESIKSNELNQKTLANPKTLSNWEFPIKKINSGSNHVLVLLSNNDLYFVKLPEYSEFKETIDSKLETTRINIPEKIIEIQAGTNISLCLCENNNLYYWFLNNECGFDSNLNEDFIKKIDIDSVSQSHTCSNENCSLKIVTTSVMNNFAALGVIFNCEVPQSHESTTSNYFSHIFIYNFDEKTISLVKYSDQHNLFKSFHWLLNHLCAVFLDDTIWFRDRNMIYGEMNDIIIRPKGDTKLLFANANGRCLIINILQNICDNSPISNTGESSNATSETRNGIVEINSEKNIENLTETSNENKTFAGNLIDSNRKEEVNPKCIESNSVKTLGSSEVSNSMFPSNTTFEASDQDGDHIRNELSGCTTLEDSKINDDQPSYQRPTISSIITKKPQKHTFLRKGEGKIKAFKLANLEKFDSKLSSNFLSNKLESNTSNSVRSNASNLNLNKKKLQEYETRIFNLESENRKILDLLKETKKRYLNDVKALYIQLKEKSDEKFPLKSVVEQLQKELFVEKEEKAKLKEDYESVKLQLQNEICNKNIKKDLLNTQLVIERDRLSKEKTYIENLYQELNNKSANLEILVAELSSKYNKLEQDHEKLTDKYNEVDQNHTLTVNQLSKSELELYELKKELELNKTDKGVSVNELYEYIDELEKSLKEIKAENEVLSNKASTMELSNTAGQNSQQENNEINNIKEYLLGRLEILKENKSDLKNSESSQLNSEVSIIIDDIFQIFTEKIKDLQEKNNLLKKKVNILEKCIKMRKDDINILVENNKN